MKAVVCTKYGKADVLKLENIAKPVPKDKQVLIKIMATTVTAGDCEIRSLRFNLFIKLILKVLRNNPKIIQSVFKTLENGPNGT